MHCAESRARTVCIQQTIKEFCYLAIVMLAPRMRKHLSPILRPNLIAIAIERPPRLFAERRAPKEAHNAVYIGASCDSLHHLVPPPDINGEEEPLYTSVSLGCQIAAERQTAVQEVDG
jgi:hypothetical protein